MRAVVSRVDEAWVSVDGQLTGRIGRGLLVYIAVLNGDGDSQVQWMAGKLTSLRIFNDDAGKMNRSVVDVGGAMLLVPNFTLAGRTQKGTRPSFSDAAPPVSAAACFEQVIRACRRLAPTEAGTFGAHMLVDARANGPVNLVIDSP